MRLALLKYIGLGLSTILLVFGLAGIFPSLAFSPSQLTEAGNTRYQSGQYQNAIELWQKAAAEFQSTNDSINQAKVLSNLALAHQQLGQYPQAQKSIEQSLNLLGCSNLGTTCSQSSDDPAQNRTKGIAQALTTLGNLQFAQGKSEQALETWKQASDRYQQANDPSGAMRAQINQAQALITSGLYRRAEVQLQEINQKINQPINSTSENQFDPTLKTASLISYGEALRLMGHFQQSQTYLEQALKLAQQQNSPADIALAFLNLGNTARDQIRISNDLANDPTDDNPETIYQSQRLKTALNHYQQAAAQAPIARLKTQAQLNQLSLLLDVQSPQTHNTQILTLAEQIQPQLKTLPLDRTKIYAEISYARNLTKLVEKFPDSEPQKQFIKTFQPLSKAAYILADAIQQSGQLQDWRAKSFGLGYLGHVYETNAQYTAAIEVTYQALALAQSNQALDIAYRWEWQAGRLYRDLALAEMASDTTSDIADNPNYPKAIGAYRSAFNTLQKLRQDLAAGNADSQFNFQTSTEDPIYRELADLLLRPKSPSQTNLIQARQVIESLQIAELENFLQEPCVAANSESIDRVTDTIDSTTAALFPIILKDRVAVILKLPRQKDLIYYSYPISSQAVAKTVESFQLNLQEAHGFEIVKQDANAIYNWLIAPVRAQLTQAKVDTLVFVPDSKLRNVPMAALYDGEKYLVESFATTIALNLELQNPKPLPKKLRVLAASLTDPPPTSIGFAPLPNVNQELDEIIKAGLRVISLRDQRFTAEAFNREISESDFSIVHLATHGQFSSDPDKTFLLTADKTIKVEDLGSLFRTRGLNRSNEIELLILSACETASGDQRATLGMAGTTVRAGAKSAIASLWSIDDETSVEMMKQFYQQLSQGKISRAAALQKAQQIVKQQEQYSNPRYWAPFILLGNWL